MPAFRTRGDLVRTEIILAVTDLRRRQSCGQVYTEELYDFFGRRLMEMLICEFFH